MEERNQLTGLVARSLVLQLAYLDLPNPVRSATFKGEWV